MSAVIKSTEQSRPLSRKRVLLLNLALAVGYFGFGLVGLSLAAPPGYATLIWPPSGLAIAFLLFFGISMAPGVLLGSFLANCFVSGLLVPEPPDLVPVMVALAIAVSSTVQAAFAALVSRKLFGVPLSFSGFGSLIKFALVVGPIACLIAATGGTAALQIAGIVQPNQWAGHWATWWLGDVAGVALVLPIALLAPWRPWSMLWRGKPTAGLPIISAIVLLVPIGLTFYAWREISTSTYERNLTSFTGLAEDNERALLNRIRSYAQGLNGAAGLVDSSTEITRKEWISYVDALDLSENLPGINGIGFIEPIPEGELEAAIARYAERGLPNLKLHPETQNQDVFMITYIEPIDINLQAVGLNIAFEDNRRAAAIRARDTGEPSITKRIFLVQDATRSAGFLLLRPTYRPGAPLSTVEERRAAFLGWVYAPFIGFKFMESLSASQGSLLSLDVYDGDAVDPEHPIYEGSASQPENTAPRFRIVKTVEVYGQQWTLVWSSTPSFESSVQSSEPETILASGMLLSALLAAYLVSLTRRTAFVEHLVRQKTKEIAERELENRSLVDTAVVGIMLTDEDGSLLSANRAAQKMFGIPSAEAGFGGVKLAELLGRDGALPQDFDELVASSEDTAAAAQTIRVRRNGGEQFEVDLQLNKWTTGSGDSRYTVIARDVSIQHRMRVALEQAEQRWSLALSGAKIGVFDIDFSTNTSIVSDTWREMLGFDADEEIALLSVWQERIHPDDRDRVLAADQACFDGKTPFSQIEYRIRHKNGHCIWLRSNAQVTERGEDGEPLRFVGTQTDVTELKTAEAALMASESQLRSAIENAPIGMALVDLDGRWLTVNEAICKLFGYSEEELFRLTFQNITHPDDLEGDLALASQLLSGEIDTYQLEKRYIHKDGGVVWGLLSVSLAHDQDGKPAYFIKQILDITHQREVQRLHGEFISTVNHELRTPLTAIRGSLEVLLAKCEQRADRTEKTLLKNSFESSKRLSRLVDDILDIQRMEEGKTNFHFETVDLRPLVEQITESQAPLEAKWDVRIETEVPEFDIPARIDTDRFTQALVNIISNAAKFSGDGDRIIVSLKARENGGARVSVQDFGPGIPEEFRTRIFGKFAQADGSSTRKAQGSGLGLNITKSIVEAFGGQIDFVTEEGKGTTFFFDLPAVDQQLRSA